MFKRLIPALAAFALAGGAVAMPTEAKARDEFSISIHLGNKDWYRPYYGRPYDRGYRIHCHPRKEVLVQDRRGRLYCISNRDYYRYYDRPYNRYRDYDYRYDRRHYWTDE